MKTDYNYDYFHGKGSNFPLKGYDSFFQPESWKRIVNRIRELKGTEISMLDVGCAYGFLVVQALKFNIDSYGVDVSEYALKQVSEIRNRLIFSSAEHLPFRENIFDVICCYDVIEHLHQPEKAINDFHRLLREGGLLFLGTDCTEEAGGNDATHISIKTSSSWMKIMSPYFRVLALDQYTSIIGHTFSLLPTRIQQLFLSTLFIFMRPERIHAVFIKLG